MDDRTERYRQAERTFWSSEGVAPTELFVDVGRARLRLQELGAGDDPVLFVHGTGGSGTYFAPLVRHLQGRRCLMLDRPGWGLSTMIDYGARPYREIVGDLLRGTLDALDLGHVDLVGASIGDLWAFRLAQAEPARVGKVVLLGGGPLTSEIKVPPLIRLLRSPLGRVMVALPEKPWMLRKQLASLGHANDAISDAFVDWHVEMTRDTDWPRNERAMVQAVVSRNGFGPGLVPSDEEASSIQQPTLMIYGSADPVGAVEIWRRFIDLIPNGTLELVEGGGHLVWYDDPEGVAGRVESFLEGGV
jgi:2-hydroxy-6-oxonona-2,4-dienedioate hydrolase